MQRAQTMNEAPPVSKMAIVDTFTKLIFGEADYSHDELLSIQALRAVDANVTLDSHIAMGEYLRAMGVREMVQLVAQVQECLSGESMLALTGSDMDSAAGHRAANRRVQAD
jgi:hypothetical protein